MAHSIPGKHLRRKAAPMLCALLLPVAASCSDEPSKGTSTIPSKTSSPSVSTPPTYTIQQIRSRLLSGEEIGSAKHEIRVAVESIKNNKAPMCSLSGASFKGEPELLKRQFFNQPKRPRDEIFYTQIVALYASPAEAIKAFSTLKKKAESCPSKQRIPARKKPGENFIYNPHDDTWKVVTTSVPGWTSFRGYEKHIEPRTSKYNVFYFMYDYATRGNVVFCSLYWERAEPDDSGDPVAQRANELLTRQLQKFE